MNNQANLTIGKNYKVVVQWEAPEGVPVSPALVVYSSSDDSIVTVTALGDVTPLAKGQAQISLLAMTASGQVLGTKVIQVTCNPDVSEVDPTGFSAYLCVAHAE